MRALLSCLSHGLLTLYISINKYIYNYEKSNITTKKQRECVRVRERPLVSWTKWIEPRTLLSPEKEEMRATALILISFTHVMCLCKP